MATIKAGETYGFFTDTSVCIGCKACEVACKEWNQLQGDSPSFLADSFDNTGSLDAQNWRHVKFIEHVPDQSSTAGNGAAWLMMSDVCKHCKHASCMEVCPTGAIIRTEFNTVFIQQDVCNGCRNCVAACPYGVIGMNQGPPTSARSATTGCRGAWSRRAPRRARPSRSSSGPWPSSSRQRTYASRPSIARA